MSATLLQTIQDMCGELGLVQPTAVMASADPAIKQLVTIANRVGREMVKVFPWQALISQCSITTVAGQDTYPLPADFQRISPQTEWDRTNHWPLLGPKTPAEWAFLKGGIVATGPRIRFRIMDGNVIMFPIPGGAFDVNFEYQSNGWVTGSGNTPQQRFALDTDTCIFDDALMIAAIELRWLERKGFDSTAAADQYDRLLTQCMAQDQDAPILAVSRRQSPLLITPANIPESNYGL